MKNEKATKEEVIQLEKKLKEINDINTRLLKEKKSLIITNEFLTNEIDSKKKEIVKYTKMLTAKDKPKEDKKV